MGGGITWHRIWHDVGAAVKKGKGMRRREHTKKVTAKSLRATAGGMDHAVRRASAPRRLAARIPERAYRVMAVGSVHSAGKACKSVVARRGMEASGAMGKAKRWAKRNRMHSDAAMHARRT